MFQLRDKKSYIVLAVIFTVLFVAFFFSIRQNGIASNASSLDKDWTLYFDGKKFDVANVSDFQLPRKVMPGDTLVMERVLPDSICSHPVLRFNAYHSRIVVYAGGEVVENYGADYRGVGFVGSGYHYSYLNRGSLGKPLRITLIPEEKDAFVMLPSFEVLSEDDAHTDFYARNMFTLCIGIFLVLLGSISVVVSLFIGMAEAKLRMLGFLSFLLGLWSMCYMKVIQVFSADLAFNTTLEYVSLYLAPLPMCLLLLNMRKKAVSKWKAAGVYALMMFDLVFLVVTSILHFTNVVRYTESLWIFHIYIGISFIFLGFFTFGNWKSTDLSNRLLSWGIAVFAFVAFADMLRYNIYRIYVLQRTVLEITWIPVGILLFVLLLLMSYLASLYKIIADKAEKDVLATMAYMDSLTGLLNRAKCQQIFDILDKGVVDFAVISLDMNGLKFVNDKFGHGAGDEQLKAFADVFRKSFAGVGTTIRMGGDEFLAIVRKEHLDDIDMAMQRMEMMLKTCTLELPIPLEAAYGIAIRSECKKGLASNSEEVYQAADEKMYAMKAQMKSKLVRR